MKLGYFHLNENLKIRTTIQDTSKKVVTNQYIIDFNHGMLTKFVDSMILNKFMKFEHNAYERLLANIHGSFHFNFFPCVKWLTRTLLHIKKSNKVLSLTRYSRHIYFYTLKYHIPNHERG